MRRRTCFLVTAIHLLAASGALAGISYDSQWAAPGTPQGVNLDSGGNLWVSLLNDDVVRQYTPEGVLLQTLGTPGSGDGQFNAPIAVAFGAGGDIYVADYLNARIQRFSSAGVYLSQWPTTWNGGIRCVYLVTDGAGNVYVTNLTTPIAKKFSPTGVELMSFVVPAADAWLSGIAVDSDENVYVTDLVNHQIYKFSSAGAYLTQWPTGFGPEQITFDDSGRLFVAAYGSDRIEVYRTDGSLVTTYGSGGTGNGQFSGAHGVAVAPDDKVYVADSGNNRIQLLTSAIATPECTPLLSGIVGWWTADGNTHDIIGGNGGALQGGAFYTTGRNIKGFGFDSDDDRVVVPNDADLDVQSAGWSAMFWMKGVKNQPEALATLIEKSHGWIDNTGWAFSIASTSGAPLFAIGDGSGFPNITGTGDVLDGYWHHIAGTWEPGTLRLYADGALQGSEVNAAPANNARDMNFGFTWGGGTPRRFFRGSIDELIVFDRALTAAEVQAIYEAGGAGMCQSLSIPAGAGPSGLDLRVWPNPVVSDADSRVQFHLPSRSEVDLSIFDIQGRRIQTVARGWMDAGTHRLRLLPHAPRMAAGVILVRLRWSGGVEVRRIGVLR